MCKQKLFNVFLLATCPWPHHNRPFFCTDLNHVGRCIINVHVFNCINYFSKGSSTHGLKSEKECSQSGSSLSSVWLIWVWVDALLCIKRFCVSGSSQDVLVGWDRLRILIKAKKDFWSHVNVLLFSNLLSARNKRCKRVIHKNDQSFHNPSTIPVMSYWLNKGVIVRGNQKEKSF